MAVYYVSKAGNDGSGTGGDITKPYVTINAAVAAAYGAGTGNIVEIIDSGQYDEGDIEIYTNAITVRATGSNTPILDGDDGDEDHTFETYVSGCIFQGLTMRQYDNQFIKGANAPGKNFILSGCIGYAFGGPQYVLGSGGSAEIHECKLVAERAAAVDLSANGHLWINNSLLATNAVGTTIVQSSVSYPNVTASFCTFVGSGHNNSSGRQYNLIDAVETVINCIVSGSGNGINAGTSSYNLVNVGADPFLVYGAASYGGTGGSTVARSANTGEITGDPLFISGSDPGTEDPEVFGNVNLYTQDFQLQGASPAIDAGTSYLGVAIDLSGTSRPQGDAPDIGAYEFISGDPIWSDYSSEPNKKWGSDFSINTTKNMSSNYKYKYDDSNRQAPFSVLSIAKIRGTTVPYKADK